jgi:hypothetical protein
MEEEDKINVEREPIKPKRPVAVRWLGYSYKWLGVFWIIAGIVLCLHSAPPPRFVESLESVKNKQAAFIFIKIVLLTVGILFVLSGIGLLNLRNWGRRGIIYLSIIIALIQPKFLVVGHDMLEFHDIIRIGCILLLTIGTIYYLHQPDIRILFTTRRGLKGMRWL